MNDPVDVIGRVAAAKFFAEFGELPRPGETEWVSDMREVMTELDRAARDNTGNVTRARSYGIIRTVYNQ